MTQNRLIGKARYITFLLRHNPQKEDLNIDGFGWVDVNELIQKLNITLQDLEWIVANDNKSRFTYNPSNSKIRANQGHSIKIDLELVEIEPPDILFHGTASKNIESIQSQGLIKMERHHVHLSSDYHTALQVGSRHGSPVVLKIKSKDMFSNNYHFYLSKNGVWLADHVPIEYIEIAKA